MQMALERELKLDADAAFELPADLGEPLEARLFTSTYYDTPPRSLLRSGITRRRRVENGLSRWQLKLPRDDGREELEAPGGPAGPPDVLRALLVAHLRHGSLSPVATLRTRRAGYRVADHGRPLADVTLDAVAVLDGQRQAGAFRELEVELVEGDDDDLDRLGKLLRRAGARRSDGRSKVMRVVPIDDDGDDPLLLHAQLRQLERHDPGVRLGDEPEDLHRFRVATRRTRAIARATRPALGERLEPLSAELAWLAGLLGPVRDLDVLIQRLRVRVADLDTDRDAGSELVAILEEQRAHHRDELLAGLDSPRYVALLDRFAVDIEGIGVPAELHELAAKAHRRLVRQARALGNAPDDEALHDLRKAAKKARYAAELVNDRKVGRYVSAVKELQDVVGAHQDAVVAEERLRAIARAKTAVAAGRLIAAERERRRCARTELRPALEAVLARGEKAFA
jgi:CHAD domain-containing protein